jgi:quercetin dioxygenase-like cupin family protein
MVQPDPGQESNKSNALEVVSYQSKAVVSKVLVHSKGGTVTLFAFDQGEGLSEHTAPFDALVLVLEGSAEVTIGGTPHRLDPNDFILMPANVPHALHAVERFKMMLTMIREKAG